MSDDVADSLVVLGKRGRPRAEEPKSRVSTWLPIDAHDKLIAFSKQQRKSVSELVRDILVQQIRPKR